MRFRVALVSCATLMLLLSTASPAAAQVDFRNSVSFAYAYLHFNADHHHGFAIDFNRNLREHGNMMIRSVGQFAFLHHSSRDIFTAAAGVQLMLLAVSQRMFPFAQATAGFFTEDGRTSFVINYGGGADFKISAADRWRIYVLIGWATLIGDHSETGFKIFGGGRYRF